MKRTDERVRWKGKRVGGSGVMNDMPASASTSLRVFKEIGSTQKGYICIVTTYVT